MNFRYISTLLYYILGLKFFYLEENSMAGGFIFAEWDSIRKEFPDFQRAFAELETDVITKCDTEWKPKTFGYLTPMENQYGRTSIIPALFRGFGQTATTPPTAGHYLTDWRQHITSTGLQTLLMGNGAGDILPEDFKIAWIGLAFPNKQMNISELKWQISDQKFIRVNIEELMSYNKPALIFEKGYILNEEESFDLYGYVEEEDYQRIVMLGAAYYKIIDKVLGAPGSAIA
jgi:hypothetical protein